MIHNPQTSYHPTLPTQPKPEHLFGNDTKTHKPASTPTPTPTKNLGGRGKIPPTTPPPKPKQSPTPKPTYDGYIREEGAGRGVGFGRYSNHKTKGTPNGVPLALPSGS